MNEKSLDRFAVSSMQFFVHFPCATRFGETTKNGKYFQKTGNGVCKQRYKFGEGTRNVSGGVSLPPRFFVEYTTSSVTIYLA